MSREIGPKQEDLHLVLVSKEQENDLDEMKKILEESLKLVGCGQCTSGKNFIFRNYENWLGGIQRPQQVSRILVAGSKGNVQSLNEVINKGAGVFK